MEDVHKIIRTMNEMSITNNVSLQTFVNVAKDTFGKDCDISVWTPSFDALYYDIRDLKKLVVSVVDNSGSGIDLKEQVKIFKRMLSIDYETDFRISPTKLKLDLIELWSATHKNEVFIQPAELNIITEPGLRYVIPYDYYAVQNPVCFLENTDIITTNNLPSNIVVVSDLREIEAMLPYKRYEVT